MHLLLQEAKLILLMFHIVIFSSLHHYNAKRALILHSFRTAIPSNLNDEAIVSATFRQLNSKYFFT
jgi:hypothetical protein